VERSSPQCEASPRLLEQPTPRLWIPPARGGSLARRCSASAMERDIRRRGVPDSNSLIDRVEDPTTWVLAKLATC